MDSELFDVFNIDNNPEPQQKTIPSQSKKRKSKKPNKSNKDKSLEGNDPSLDGVNRKRPNEDLTKSDLEDDVEPPQTPKKHRKIDEIPIIVDSFETESDQIVPAIQDFEGTPIQADQNIIIKKRVLVPF